MKKIMISALLLAMTLVVAAQDNDQELIAKVLIESYVQAVFIDFNEEQIREGFHKDFQFHLPMMTSDGRRLKKVSLDDWVKLIRNMKFGEIDSKIIEVNYSGNAASTVSEIYQDGKKLYTDYMVWSKVDDKWMIMAKTYDMHQKRLQK